MVRLRIFGSGRVLLEDEKGSVVDEFIVPDPEKAQEVAMEYLQKKKTTGETCGCKPQGGSCNCGG